MRSRRRRVAENALRALQAERDERVAELARLESAIAILERADVDGDDRCDAHHPDSPCEGVAHARFCRHCGHLTRRCATHGGLRAATHAAGLHQCPAQLDDKPEAT